MVEIFNSDAKKYFTLKYKSDFADYWIAIIYKKIFF